MAARKKAAKKTARKTARKKTPRRKAARRKAARRKTGTRKKAPRKAAPGRWGLALAGDWSRGGFLAGAVDCLRQRNALPEIAVACGAGSGALVVALAALGKFNELRALFNELDARRLVRPRYPWLPGGPAASFLLSTLTGTPSLHCTNDGLRVLVHEHVDPIALESCATEVHFVATDLQTGRVHSFSNRKDAPDALMAGLLAACSRPVLMPPVRAGFERHQYAEGALDGFGPLRVLLDRLGAKDAPAVARVVAISTDPPPATRADAYRDIAAVFERTAGIAAAGAAASDVAIARLAHALLAVKKSVGARRFAEALKDVDPEVRAAVERLASGRPVPIAHVAPTLSVGPDTAGLDPASSRAWFVAGAAAATSLIG